MSEASINPKAVFQAAGLYSKGGWRTSIPLDENGSDDPVLQLCKSLPKLGGLYAAFARFLNWRADLLDARCLSSLRDAEIEYQPVPLRDVAAIIQSELGDAGAELKECLEAPLLWSTLFRTAYLSRHLGRPVVVQVARKPIGIERFLEFDLAMLEIRHPDVAGIACRTVLSQFQQWYRNGESLSHERSFLDVLSHHSGETLAVYPVPISDLSTPALLCWNAAAGRSAKDLITRGDASVSTLIASALIEQYYSLSMVDADPEPDAMIIDRNNQLHFRRFNNPIAVPPARINDAIKYTSAVLAGNASLSAQTLIRLTIAHPPLEFESMLMDEFSGVEPELKINRWFPPSAAAFESNWRALAKIAESRPLFLDCLLRNLVATGYWNSDAVRAGARQHDAISEAQAPVVQRMVKTQFGMLMNKDAATEWAMGSGLLVFGVLKEMNRLFEEVRENDLTVGVDMPEATPRELRKSRWSHALLLAALLCILLTSLLLGGTAPAPWPTLLRILAVATLPAMFWAVWRLG